MTTKMGKKKIVLIITAIALIAVIGIGVWLAIWLPSLNKDDGTDDDTPPEETLSPVLCHTTVTAHTGCMGTKDNSLESIEVAIEIGADIVEFDLRFNAAGEAFLSHDAFTSTEGLVTLEEAFALIATHSTLQANIDIKDGRNLAEVQRLAEKYDLIERIFYTGAGFPMIERIKTNSPKIAYFCNIDIPYAKWKEPDYWDEVITNVKASGALGINMEYKNVSQPFVDKCHENGLLLSLWTIDARITIEYFVAMNVDNITSRNPHLVITAIASYNLALVEN